MVGFIISIIAGIITGLGMGGGAILIVVLTLFTGIEQKIAQGINYVFFIPTSIIINLINMKRRLVKYKITIPIILSGIGGTILGSLFATKIDTSILRKIFSGFIIIIAMYEIYTIHKDNKMNKSK